MLWRKGAVIAVLVTATSLGLTACDQNMSQGPVALQRDGNDLAVAICADIDAKSMLIESWASGNGTPTETVLDAAGVATIRSGDVFLTGESVEGLTTFNWTQPATEPGRNFAIQILPRSSNADDINATFTIGKDGLSESVWLHPDGQETTNPANRVAVSSSRMSRGARAPQADRWRRRN